MFLGIDLGTSELKALLLDERQRIVGQAGVPLTRQQPQPLWSEQAPAAWWAAIDAALMQLARDHPAAMAAVSALGLTGQMHGAVLLDAACEVLRPAILWNDGRSAAQCTALEAAVPESRHITGNLAMPGFTAPKLMWVREHEPELFARVRKVLLPKDWLRWRLTGQMVSDMSDASGTLWLDVAKRAWSPLMLEACGLTTAHMPALAEGTAVAGRLAPELAARWGLARGHGGGPAPEDERAPDPGRRLHPGLPVAAGGGDNAASAVGMGAVGPGQGFVSLGTSGVIFLAGDRFKPNPEAAVHTFCHALPGRWHQMSVMLSAASALRWACELLGVASEAALVETVAALPEARLAAAPLFLPYLSGERTPHNDALASGVLHGLRGTHGGADVAYAVIEGVCFGLRDGWLALGAAPGDVAELSLVGGGARSAWWAQLLASALEVPLVTHEGGDSGGALGAARLAWLATGGAASDVCRRPPVRQRFEPEAGTTQRLAPRHALFHDLYQAVRLLQP